MALFTTLIFKYPRCQRSFIMLSYRSVSKWQEYKKCYEILGIPEDSDQEQIRIAYVKLVKRYHPDSGTKEADVSKFHEIDEAFKTLSNKKAKERWNVDEDAHDEVEEQNIRHTAPQHRQYLSFEGVGSGTIFQREKQYAKIRAMQATENVLQHRINKVTIDDKSLMVKAPLKHKIKTKYGFDRLVEDLIQESMSRGEFSNLSGCGKPLPDNRNNNPYVDSVTHKLNEVLIENGFTPEWISMQKEIREEIKALREGLSTERSYFGPYPLSTEENIEWTNVVCKYETTTDQINKKISRYNLVVPILDKQMMPLELRKEAQKVVINGKFSTDHEKQQRVVEMKKAAMNSTNRNDKGGNIFGLFDILFRK